MIPSKDELLAHLRSVHAEVVAQSREYEDGSAAKSVLIDIAAAIERCRSKIESQKTIRRDEAARLCDLSTYIEQQVFRCKEIYDDIAFFAKWVMDMVNKYRATPTGPNDTYEFPL